MHVVFDFNPRTPCGVRPKPWRRMSVSTSPFQSTHPVRGATTMSDHSPNTMLLFQSTHPVRGATIFGRLCMPRHVHFNPRTPCGVRRYCGDAQTCRTAFQSTHPVRGATLIPAPRCSIIPISIHAPRAGCDQRLPGSITHKITIISIHAPRAGCDFRFVCLCFDLVNFNPRTPCGVRL